jgi:hypothetical protein
VIEGVQSLVGQGTKEIVRAEMTNETVFNASQTVGRVHINLLIAGETGARGQRTWLDIALPEQMRPQMTL